MQILNLNSERLTAFYHSLKENAPYCKGNISSCIQRSFCYALPGASVFGFIASAVIFAVPEWILDSSENSELNSNSKFVIETPAQIDRFADFYLEHGIKADSEYQNLEIFKKHFKKEVKNYIGHIVNKTEEYNQKFNSSAKVSCCLISSKKNPFSAYGSDLSYTSPIIYIKNPTINLEEFVPENIEAKKVDLSTLRLKLGFENDETDFILAHEFRHIKNHDAIKKCFELAIASFLSTFPWVYNYFSSDHWAIYFIKSYLQAHFIETITLLARDCLSRSIETRADLGAFDFLNTTEGAQKLFLRLIDLNPSYTHPTPQKRIQLAKEWDAKRKKESSFLSWFKIWNS